MATPGQSPPSGLPPSMGPGARPMRPGEQNPGSIIKEVAEIRSHYNVAVRDDTVSVGYQLRGEPHSFGIPFAAIPLGGLPRWLLYGGPSRAQVSGIFLIDAIRGAENMVSRQLNQQEAEGFALHASKRILWSFAGTASAFGAAIALTWSGRHNMKFPFKKPRELESYNNFPNRYLPLLRGPYAQVMWHCTRYSVYATLGLLLLSPLANAMGDTSMMVGLYRDPRTKDVIKSMKGGFDRINSNRSRAGEVRPAQLPQAQNREQQDDEDPDLQGYYKDAQNELPDGYSSVKNYTGNGSYTDGVTDTGMLSDNAMQQNEARQSSSFGSGDSRGFSSQVQPAQGQEEDRGRSSSKDFFDVDDASPTAGNDRGMDSTAPYQPPGSVWARIRRGGPQQAPSQSPQGSQPSDAQPRQTQSYQDLRQRQPENPGDSFSFSQGDAERQFAKEQAQKEFDDMLEKERKERGGEEYAQGMYAAETGRQNANTGESVWAKRRRGN